MANNETFVDLVLGKDSVRVYKYGATVSSWKSDGQEQLFLSEKAILDGSKPIRGGYFHENHAGIPVVWPQFAKMKANDIELPQHAFARNSIWTLTSQTTNSLVFFLNKVPKEYNWPFKFELHYTVTLADKKLTCELKAKNLDSKSFEFTSLLHTYFKINNVGDCTVSGLSNSCYDKVLDNTRDQKSDVEFKGEVDLIFMNAPNKTVIKDGNKTITVEKTNFNDVVVWNPDAKAKGMSDLEENGEKKFICVETGSVWEKVTLESEKTWVAAMTISIN